MTEERAKTKWCPMRRLIEIGNVRVTNAEPGNHTLNCIGSECAMWRWTRRPERMQVRDGFTMTPGEGVCGLAGAEYVT